MEGANLSSRLAQVRRGNINVLFVVENIQKKKTEFVGYAIHVKMNERRTTGRGKILPN